MVHDSMTARDSMKAHNSMKVHPTKSHSVFVSCSFRGLPRA